jgi:hypothetical protein
MLNSKITNGIIIMMATGFLLSLSVIPTVSLGNSAIQSAGAQTEPTTTSSSSTHRTFHAEGVVGNLNLAPTTLESIPPPETIAGRVGGGNWSLDVVDGEVQDFALTLMSVDANGKNFQKRELRNLTNVQPGVVIPTIENATAATSSSTGDNNNTNQGIVLDGNNTSFTGNVIGVSEAGTDAQLSVIFNLVNGNLINVYLQIAAEPLSESDRLPIFGITTSLTDENGNSLLEGRE